MGVRHLWQYVRSTLRRTFHLTSKTVENPTIVIDLLGGSRRYLVNDYVWDFHKLKNRVRRDVEGLRNAGFTLIVFADGGLDHLRFDRWFERRTADMDKLYKLNSLLLSDSPERTRIATVDWRPPLSIGHYLSQAFHSVDCPVHIAQESADREGAGLCIKHDACGVLSSDTDFLIYPGIRRFFYFQSLRIEENGDVFVDGIERSLFHRYLGISEEKLPMIVGFLGNDLFDGVTLRDIKYLQYKWRLDYLPEAAAMEVKNTPTALLPEASRLALDYYKPLIPKEDPNPMLHIVQNPEWSHLKNTKSLARGVSFDSLSEKPCHDVLLPLRKAVYARNTFTQVTEHICTPQTSQTEWKQGIKVQVSKETPQAPEPEADVENCIALCCSYLLATGELNDFHYRALVLQRSNRDELLERSIVLPTVPRIKDLHIANLFLQTVEIMYLGSKAIQPPCWEIFHGPLFHYLCQEQTQIETLDSSQYPNSEFDWGPILKRELLQNENSKDITSLKDLEQNQCSN